MAREATALVVVENVPGGALRPARLELVWNADKPDDLAALGTRAPKHMVAFYRGYMSGTAGENAKAVDLFREAIRFKADFAEAHSNLGAVLLQDGKREEAIAALHEAIRVKPDFALAHRNLAVALWQTGKREEAIAALHEAIRVKPDFALAHCNLANALDDSGQHREAIAAFREAIRLNPDVPEWHNDLGFMLAAQGEWGEAIAAYREAIRLNPDLDRPYGNLAVALVQNGQYSAALAAYRNALAHFYSDEDRAELTSAINELLKRKNADLLDATNQLLGLLPKANYNIDMGNAARDLNALADDLGYTSFEQAKRVLERGAPKTARDNTARATAEPHPETAPAPLAWPSEKWKGSPEELSRKQHAIVAFMRRVWRPFIEESGAVVTLAMLRKIDKPAAGAWATYVSRNGPVPDIAIVSTNDLARADRPAVFTGQTFHKRISAMP